jgi:hypothetical protein
MLVRKIRFSNYYEKGGLVMFHWTTVFLLCFISGFTGFMAAAVLNMSRDERRQHNGDCKLQR